MTAEARAFNVKSEIMLAIAKTTDENMKIMLLLMLGVLEEISSKIDALRSDEAWLRESVLNGHATNHDCHHEWIDKRIAADCGSACEWSRKKMEQEVQDVNDAKDLIKTGKKAAVEQAVRAIVFGAIGILTGLAGALVVLK